MRSLPGISCITSALIAFVASTLLMKEQLEDDGLTSGQTIVLASVGAGMNINAVVYRTP